MKTLEELKALATWLGKVVTTKGGRRRYVVTQVHFYGLDREDGGFWTYTIAALSGGFKGSHDTNHGEETIAERWEVAADQTITFSGKNARRRAAVYNYDTSPLNEEITDTAATIVADRAEYDGGTSTYPNVGAISATK
jgi:hypothetical protein